MPPPVQWEIVSCPLCGATGDREFLRATDRAGARYRLGQCAECRLVYTNPRPDAASIAQFYPEDYAPYQPPARIRKGFLRALRSRLGLRGEKGLTDRIPVRPGGVMLDYGCGCGWFAAQMRDRGWNAIGMDFSEHATASARKHFGLQVIHGVLPHPAVAPGSLDVIALGAVLEHVHDPQQLLRAVHDALRPGGWVYVSVPNLASWGFRAFRQSWFPLDLPRHLLHFTPDTLLRVIETCGFRVEVIKTIGHTKWVGYSVEQALKDQPRWWVWLCRAHVIRSAITRWARWTGQADNIAILARKPFAAPVAEPVPQAA